MLYKKSMTGAAVLAATVLTMLTPSAVLGQADDADTPLLELLGAETEAPAATDSAEPAATPDGETGDAAAVEPTAAEPETTPTIPVVEMRPEATPPPPSRGGPAQLEEIVVTATKRSQSVRDIPASITAFSGEKLENSGKLNLNDFIQESPGVTAAQGAPGFTRLTFRGISTDTLPTAGNAQPVGIFIGDTPFTDPYIANIVPDLSAFDLAGVQVLKGPQGTLFGGAALSGAIRYELEEPMLDTWQLRGFTQYAQPKDGSTAFTSGVAVNLPVTDANVALRLAYVRREYPGITDDTRSGEEDVAESAGNQYRGQLLWMPGDWKFKLTHITQDFEGDNQMIEVDSPTGPRETNRSVLPAPSENEFNLDSLEINYEFETMRLVSLSSKVSRDAYFTRDITYSLAGIPPPGYPATAGVLTEVIDNSESFSQEIRLQSNGDSDFNWLLGAYYFDYEMFFNILIDTPLNQSLLGPGSVLGENPLLANLLGLLGVQNPAAATSLLDGTSRAESTEKALFADVSYKLFDELTLSVGGRYYQTQTSGGFVGNGLLVSGNNNNGLGTDSRAEIKEHGFNPKASVTWDFSENASIYASAAKGYRFGGLQSLPSTPTNGVPPTYKSDTLWNYEVGLRTTWLDRTLQADLTAFYIRYTNPIVTQSTQGVPIAYNTNVSAAISRGFEGNILWNTPLDGLTWSIAAGYTDAHITEEFEASNGDIVEPGQEMPGAAKYQYSSTLSYLQFWDRITLAPNVNYVYVGQGYSNITHDVEINGFGTLNAGLVLGTQGVTGKPQLAINLTNVLDEVGVVAGATGNAIVTQQPGSVYLLNPPRTITARLSFEF